VERGSSPDRGGLAALSFGIGAPRTRLSLEQQSLLGPNSDIFGGGYEVGRYVAKFSQR